MGSQGQRCERGHEWQSSGGVKRCGRTGSERRGCLWVSK